MITLYIWILILGFVTLGLFCLPMLQNEMKYRKKRFIRKFRNAVLCVYEKEPEEKGGKYVMLSEFIPLSVAECTVGRKHRDSVADYRIKTGDRTFSGNAARFFFDGERFHVQCLERQKRIWVKKADTGKVFLIHTVNADIGATKQNGFGGADFEVLQENDIVLGHMDRIILGKTMLEYVEGDERVNGN